MGQPAAEPQRRCVGCGRTAAKRDLLRLVATDGLAVPDPVGVRAGRGAYVCRHAAAAVDPACLDRAIRRGGLSRALRRSVRVAPGLLDHPAAGDPPHGDLPSNSNLLESMG